MKIISKTIMSPTLGKRCLSIPRNLMLLTLMVIIVNNVVAADSTRLFNYLEYNDTEQLNNENVDSILTHHGKLSFTEIMELKIAIAKQIEESDVIYVYKLHGFDFDWDTTNMSILRYTNLPGGSYQLEIMVCKNDEILDVFKLPFSVFNPVQKQWWFGPLLTFCLLLIPFTIFYFFNLDRSRRVLQLESVRNQIASDLHDDIGANLSAIKNFTELIQKKTPKENASGELIKKTKEYLNQTIVSLQDTVFSINPLNDSVELLIEKMQDFAIQMFSGKEIDLRLNNDYNLKAPVTLDMDQRHCLLLMFKEVINNIVKHAEASKVNIHISNTKEALDISVNDNGKGFDTKTEYAGNGLRNFKSRSRQNFIETEIQSKIDKGTKVHITVHSL